MTPPTIQSRELCVGSTALFEWKQGINEPVRLTRIGDRSIEQIATDLDLTESALRNGVGQAAEL